MHQYFMILKGIQRSFTYQMTVSCDPAVQMEFAVGWSIEGDQTSRAFLLWTDRGPAQTRVVTIRIKKAWQRAVRLEVRIVAIIVESRVVKGRSWKRVVNDDVVTKGENLLSNCHQDLLTSSGQWRGSMLGLVPPRESDLGLLTRGVPTVFD